METLFTWNACVACWKYVLRSRAWSLASARTLWYIASTAPPVSTHRCATLPPACCGAGP
jgi:hypothetical protein